MKKKQRAKHLCTWLPRLVSLSASTSSSNWEHTRSALGLVQGSGFRVWLGFRVSVLSFRVQVQLKVQLLLLNILTVFSCYYQGLDLVKGLVATTNYTNCILTLTYYLVPHVGVRIQYYQCIYYIKLLPLVFTRALRGCAHKCAHTYTQRYVETLHTRTQ